VLAAACAPTMPPAPALLSTTAATFQACAMGWVVRRAVVSTGPPGGKGTMKLTGRSGHLAAWACSGRQAAAQAAPNAVTRRRRCTFCIGESPIFLVRAVAAAPRLPDIIRAEDQNSDSFLPNPPFSSARRDAPRRPPSFAGV